MIPRSPTTASGRPRRMMLLVLVYLVCLGRVTASSVNNGKIQLQQQIENPTIDHKNPNNSKVAESTNNIPDKVYRQSRALPRFENSEAVESSEEEAFLESVQKSPSEINSLYVIPHLRPGRTTTQILDSDESDQLENIFELEDKRNSYTAIPMLRYGRSNSLIPIPRFGRYVESSEQSNPDLSHGNILDNQDRNKEEIFENDVIQHIKKNNMIPIPRYGRSESMIPMLRFGRSDAIIPMMRYGRSDSLIPMPRYGRSGNLIPTARYGRSESLIPMARYGRSDTLIPTARYGRSSSLIPMARYGRSETLIPMARYGRSDSLIPIPRFGKSVDSFENSDFDSDEIKNEKSSEEEYNLESLKSSKRRIDDNGAIIPYPRPGREIETEVEKKEDELKSFDSEVRRQTNESLIPQIRYGRSSGKTKTPENEQSHIFILPNIRPGRSSKEAINNKEKENSKSVQYGLLPYPRPGRSEINQNDMNSDDLNEDLDSTLEIKRSEEGNDEQIILESEEDILLEPGYSKPAKEHNLINSDQDSSRFVIPYPRPGKRDLNEEEASTTVLPGDANSHPHLFKITKGDNENAGYSSFYSNEEKMGDGRNLGNKRLLESEVSFGYLSNPHLKFQKRSISSEKSTFLLPYPRLGRSSSLLPYPRPGRSNTILPFPRPGRSNSVLPYPRPGRSHSILPYPRLGRSTTILPYPRPGRSDLILPYPRPGRSNSIVPFPRPGRSDVILPYPRPGRSDLLLPYPRPGRSDVILPYPRPGRSDLLLPYPRPGRSDAILPYPRLGRSTSIVPIPRPGRSAADEILKRNAHEYLLPYSQTENNSEFFATFFREDGPGSQSSKLKDVPSLAKKLNKEISSSNSIYLLPYPRPGRVVKRNFA
ncbi:hypothetical protein AVEN_155028-1 [Araneus ventricosus]|uniref:Uncharacterized protein n=1 Tax=Araneus ventricosus TaxID=182803 RepID=A0A4Y2A9W5_ARAVE|nr:hypothetical protein AVEN_155028-1 [Araneus ventricosus]